MAIFFACFIRKSDHDKEAAEYLDDNIELNLGDDEEYLQSINARSTPFSHRSYTRVNRLAKEELNHIRQQRLRELKMWSMIQEMLSYFCFLCLLYSVSYSNLNPNEFYQVDHLKKFILNSRQSNLDYTKV